MKLCSLILISALSASSVYAQSTSGDVPQANTKGKSAQNAQKANAAASSLEQDRARVFAGTGVMGGGYGVIGAEVIAGYHYFFPKDMYIDGKIRQGLRAYASAGYSYSQSSGYYWEYSDHYVPVVLGVDYTLEVNPHNKFVWGTYVGLGLGFVGRFHQAKDKFPTAYYDASYTSNRYGVAWDAYVGGSLTIDNRHRFELDVGAGSSYFSLRYLLLL